MLSSINTSAPQPWLSLFHPVQLTLLFCGQGNNTKPDAGKLQDLLKPTGAAMEKMESLKDRRSKQFNHLAMVAEGGQCLQWVCIEPTPAPYLGDVIPASEMYSNKVFPNPCLKCGHYIRRCVCGATRVFVHSSFSDAGIIFANIKMLLGIFRCFGDDSFYFLCDYLPTFSGPCPVCFARHLVPLSCCTFESFHCRCATINGHGGAPVQKKRVSMPSCERWEVPKGCSKSMRSLSKG